MVDKEKRKRFSVQYTRDSIVCVLGGGGRSRGIHDRLPPESMCILMEKGKENTGFAGRMGDV